jgi:hypothetical protein
MQQNLPANRPGRWLAGLGLVLLTTLSAQAQLTGIKTIPGSYATLAAAITDLNAQGVGTGGVTFNVAAGYTETAANLLITATGTAANPIVFQKLGAGANPLITAGVGTSTTLDGVIELSGADYVTIDGIDVAESAANATATTQMEFGYALFRASATDGCQNNIIRNCVVTLNKANANTIGIYGAPSTAASATAISATSAAGGNSGNKVYGNVVTNAVSGIYFAAGSATSIANYDQNNEIGVTAGNTIGNFGGTASGWGAGGNYQNGLKITGNTLNSTLNYTSASASTPVAASTVTSALRGIYTPNGTSVSLDITGNTITLASGGTTALLTGIENGMGSTPASNTVNINRNTLAMSYLTATSATVSGFYNNGSPATLNLSDNTLGSTALSNTGSTYLIYNNHSATAANVLNNQLGGITRTGTSGTVYGYYNNGSGAGTQTLTGNVITNISVAGASVFYGLYNTSAVGETQLWSANQITNITASASPTGALYGIYNTYGAAGSQFFNNTITGLSGGGTVYGLNLTNSALATAAAYGNTIGALSSSGTSSSIYGLYTSVTTPTIYRNKIYGLSGTGTGATIYGLYTGGGTTITLHNNLIGDLQAPAATGLTAVSGMYFSSGTTINAYYNTVYLAATSSGATFGTAGIYFSTTPTTVDLRNNIVVNKSTAAGAGGYTAALRRASGTAGTVPASLAATSNNNLYYAGTPSATNMIYVEGTTTATNAQQTLAAYKAFAGGRELASVTEDAPFVSTTGTAATFLHISASAPTQVESGGTPIGSITTDYDGDTRSTTTPDIGADEGAFRVQDLTPPSIVYTALGSTTNATTRTLTATITDASGVATGANAPRLFYRKGSVGPYVSVPATTVSGSSYTFTFNYSLVGGVTVNDPVQYYVAAQDAAPTPNAGTSPAGGTYTQPPITPNTFTVYGTLSGTYYVGTSATLFPSRTYFTLTEAAAAYNGSNLGGPVNFMLVDGNYSSAETFPIVFNANADASATNTLTIKANPGILPVITSNSTAPAVLQFNGADYITVDGANTPTSSRSVTLISGNNSTASATVWLASQGVGAGATNVTLKNLVIVGGSPTLSTAFGVYAGGTTLSASGTGEDNDNLTIASNAIFTAYEAVYARGVAGTGLLDNLLITDNTIGSATAVNTVVYRGVDVQNATAPVIQQNSFEGMVTTASVSIAAIDLGANVTNAAVRRNRISGLRSSSSSGYGAYGINISAGTTSGIEISNNMISDILTYDYSSSTTFNPFGIRITGGTGHKVYYNSVNLAGAIPSATASSSNTAAALVVTSSSATGLDVRNNIFACSVAGPSGNTAAKSYALYASAASSFATLDYNDYYVSGGNGVLAYVAADVTTLAALRTATGKDANSLSADPIFVSATDLHASATALDGKATPLAGITTDFDGDVRNATTPDIGADEFTLPSNDLAAAALIAPATTSTCYGTAEAVSVSIRNAGSTTINFATTTATITVVVTLPGGTTQTLTTTLTTGTLASNATQTVTLPTALNMSTVGTYSFAITATVAGDGNTANDLLAPAPTRTVAAPVAGTLAPASSSICVSGTATLTLTGAANGSIQYQSSSDNVTFTDIAGATSATYTTPVLTTTTYYRAQVRCNTGTATSNVSTITVNNPLVASTNTPVSVCAGTSATLTATASAGSAVRFFSTPTGGTALAATTAGTYTTPALTASTTYYAEAYSGSTENVGATAYNSTGQTPQTGGALYFTATAPTTIANVTVYLNAGQAAGTVTINLRTGSSTTGAIVNSQSTAFAVPAGPATGVAPYIIPLNYQVPAAGAYTLHLSAASQGGLLRDDSGANPTGYPYAAPSGAVRITGASVSGYYYYFYNWQLGSECVGATRTAIQVNVTQPATATFSYPATGGNCAGSTGTVAATLATGATAGTFTSTTGLTLNATTGAVNLATSTAGTYTVTNTVAAAGGCGAVTATVTITVNPTPARPTLTAAYNGTTTTLTSSAATGNQFYFNGTAIAGATGQTYVVNGSATTYGSYTVVVTNSFGCSSAASVATVVTTTRSGIAGASLLVYPNPTPNGQVTLELSGFRSATQLAVIDALGRVVRTEALPATAGVVTHQLNLSGMAAGVYMLRLTNADGVETRRLVRE